MKKQADNVATSKSGKSKMQSRRAPKVSEFKVKSQPLPLWRDAKSSLERWLLTEALRNADGNMAAAGRLLGITKVAVLHAVRRHGLEEFTEPS